MKGGFVTTTTPVMPAAQAADVAAGHDIRRYVVFAICACIYILPFMRLLVVGTDEGILDYGALRVFRGQVFARDFFEVIGPGTFYWLAGFYKLFGVSFFTTRICLFITSFGTAFLMYFLSRRICGKYQALPCVLLAGTCFGGLWPAMSHHDDSNFFALLAVASIALWQEKGTKALLVAGGVLSGATTAFLQPKGMLLAVAICLFVYVQTRRRSSMITSLGLVVGGYASVVGLVLFYFWSKNALGDLVYVDATWPLKHYGTVNAVPYAHAILFNYWDHWVSVRDKFPWIVPVAVVMFIPLLYVAALPALLPLIGARFRWHLLNPQIQLLWLAGLAIWASELHRTDMAHLVFGSPLLMILSIHFLTSYTGRWAEGVLQVIVVSSVCLAGFNLLILSAAHKVETRMGTVRILPNTEALEFVIRNVKPGEEIFSYPYAPSFYFLADAVNPTQFSIMTYNFNTTDQFQEVIRTLDRDKVKFVVWDVAFEQMEQMVFLSGFPPADQQIIEPYLESHYDVIKVADGKRIMQRKAHINEHQ